jgi:hypothetical protein
MAKIGVRVTQTKPSYKFNVRIEEGDTATEHSISMSRSFCNDFKTEAEPRVVVEESIRFLLENEPKENILKEFDITIISYHFPDYLKQLKKVLNKRL